jgi:hypothetical protein
VGGGGCGVCVVDACNFGSTILSDVPLLGGVGELIRHNNTKVKLQKAACRETLFVLETFPHILTCDPSARSTESGWSVRSRCCWLGPRDSAARSAGSSKPSDRTAAASSQK